ncbi:MAG: hypothetical protein E6Q97_18915 [Desulfurellales bacterium]|nr:MAG: hypothetical protein E6Q97_18915 [Desulfurellales bacterium]
MNLSDRVVAIIRTVVPAAVGTGIVLVEEQLQIDLDNEAIMIGAVAVTTGAFYAIVRWAEERWPKTGWLLGVRRVLTYRKP